MSFLTSLLNALPGAVAQGLIWGIMAIGVYITYRILDVADLTVDGSLATGGAVCVMLIRAGVSPWPALLCAMLAGMLAGLVTGLFHTKCGIPAILAGILTQLSLYSVNLRIMESKANQAVSVDKYDLLVSQRYVRTFWGLDRALAYARHFPSINWLTSYSEYADDLRPWYDEHVGPEFVTGSTRMKAGTAQKLMLNMISTAVMIRLGRVEGNKMVNMQLTNNKLVDRGTRMIVQETGIAEAEARALLLACGSVKAALDKIRRGE